MFYLLKGDYRSTLKQRCFFLFVQRTMSGIDMTKYKDAAPEIHQA